MYLYLNQTLAKYLYLYLKNQIFVFVFVFGKTYLTPALIVVDGYRQEEVRVLFYK